MERPLLGTKAGGAGAGRLRAVLQDAVDRAFGYDFFISYGRRDGTPQALALHEALRSHGLVCFLDREEFVPGGPLPESTRRAVRKSSALILLATPAALASPHVATEVRLAQSLGRALVPVSFDDCLTRQPVPWVPPELLRLDTATDGAEGWPEARRDLVVAEILRRVRLTRQNTRRLRIFVAIAAVLTVVTALAVRFGVGYRGELIKTLAAARLATARNLAADDPTLAALVLREVPRDQRDARWQLAALDVLDRPLVARRIRPENGLVVDVSAEQGLALERDEEQLSVRALDGGEPLARRRFPGLHCARLSYRRGEVFALAEGRVHRWTLGDGAEVTLPAPKPIEAHGATCRLEPSPGGDAVLAWSLTAGYLWSGLDPASEPIQLTHRHEAITSCRFDRDGLRVLMTTTDRAAELDLDGGPTFSMDRPPEEHFRAIDHLDDQDAYVIVAERDIEAAPSMTIRQTALRVAWPGATKVETGIASMGVVPDDEAIYLHDRGALLLRAGARTGILEEHLLLHHATTLFPKESFLGFVVQPRATLASELRALGHATLDRLAPLSATTIAGYASDGVAGLWALPPVAFAAEPLVSEAVAVADGGRAILELGRSTRTMTRVLRRRGLAPGAPVAVLHRMDLSPTAQVLGLCGAEETAVLRDVLTGELTVVGRGGALPRTAAEQRHDIVLVSCDRAWALAQQGEDHLLWIGASGAVEAETNACNGARLLGVEAAAGRDVVAVCADGIRVQRPGGPPSEAVLAPERRGAGRLLFGGINTARTVLMAVRNEGSSALLVLERRDPRTGALDDPTVVHLTMPSFNEGYPPDVSADGAWMAFPGRDAVELMRVDQPSYRVSLRTGHIGHVRFSPDGKRLFWVSIYGGLRTWSLDPKDVSDALDRATTACLSVPERVEYLGEDVEAAVAAAARCEKAPSR
jgi:hypothetical protein